jgi:hypothetical protein
MLGSRSALHVNSPSRFVFPDAYFCFSALPVLLVRPNTVSAEYNVSAMPLMISNVPINGHSANVSSPPSTIAKAHIDENKPISNCLPTLNLGMPPHALNELRVSEFLPACSQTSTFPVFAVVWHFPSDFSTRPGIR